MTAPARVAVVDRTGRCLAAVHEVGEQLEAVEVLEVPRSSDFDLGGVGAEVLVLGPRELSRAGLRRARRWADQHPDAVVLAALDPGPVDVDALTAAGVSAWCAVLDVAGLVDLLDDALSVEPAAAPPPEPEPVEEPVPGSVVTVVSAGGGSGQTFLATNLATALAQAGRRVCLVDLDMRGERLAAALHVRHPHSVYDGLYDAKGRRLPPGGLSEHLAALVHRHAATGLDLLLAPQDQALGELVTGEDVAGLLDVLVEHYDVVVVDSPVVLDDVALSALERADVVPVLAVLDVPSLKGLRGVLEVLGELGVRGPRRRLVLNKVEADLGLDVGQVVEAFDDEEVTVLPLDRAVSRSVNTGRPLLVAEPRAAAARALRAALPQLLPGLLDAPPAALPSPSLSWPRALRRLGRGLSSGASL